MTRLSSPRESAFDIAPTAGDTMCSLLILGGKSRRRACAYRRKTKSAAKGHHDVPTAKPVREVPPWRPRALGARAYLKCPQTEELICLSFRERDQLRSRPWKRFQETNGTAMARRPLVECKL